MKVLEKITGERIYLAKIPDEAKCHKKYMELLNAQHIMAGTGGEPHTLKEVKELFEEWDEDKDNMTWGIFRKSDDELIGDVCLRYGYEEYDNDGPEVAIMVGEAKGGYGSEAMRLLLDYAFGERKLFGQKIKIINLGFYKENIGAFKLYSKLGFKEVREQLDNGKTEVIMEMTREMWKGKAN